MRKKNTLHKGGGPFLKVWLWRGRGKIRRRKLSERGKTRRDAPIGERGETIYLKMKLPIKRKPGKTSVY